MTRTHVPAFIFSAKLIWVIACLMMAFSGLAQTVPTPFESVNPFMGTANHGHVYPGATVPFGMVQLSPDNGTQGWDWCAGYNWADSLIVGFSHTHLSGTGIGDLYDVLLMPAITTVDWTKAGNDPRNSAVASTFSHEQESAAPGYYFVRLDNAIQIELTASTFAGIHRYSYPAGETPSVVLDLGFAINWDRPTQTGYSIVNPQLITGYRLSTGWAKDQRIYFAMSFSAPIIGRSTWQSPWVTPTNENSTPLRGTKGQFFFAPSLPGGQLVVKVALSSASEEGALAALADVDDQSFDDLEAAARSKWEQTLQQIQIKTPVDSLANIFYTSFYRTKLAPVIFTDIQQQFKGADGNIASASGYQRYDIFSLWDTFRAAHPLFTITEPNRINEMIRSLLDHYDQTGLLPVWSLLGNETNTMTGYHAVPVIVDAYLKGFRDYDVEKAYTACKASAMQDIRGTNFLREFGYIPHDKDGESVTKTLEYAFDDWCIGQFAQALGKTEDAQYFAGRAQAFQQLFDASTGFMRAKMSDGTWKVPFDPYYSDHNGNVAEYTEGNAWQHSWFVPHDVPGLISLHGDDAAFIKKLDSLFTVSSKVTGENASSDISGLIGQYAHGNEPSHHIAYLYNYAGMPWKTQERVRDIMLSQYNEHPHGLCGNEDCGQMSAWYVFSALGFYPVNPAAGIYVLGSPLFESSLLNVGNGRIFRIEATGNPANNPYIQSARLNGKPLKRSFLTHSEIMQGGKLEVVMGPKPNKTLWTKVSTRPR
ncbi:MAG: glycoside hydrolase family 92 protein [Lewinellaceae bacterium]|nr:glycoside hydrolase family 92 protein [Lewinellaceae bacterium]